MPVARTAKGILVCTVCELDWHGEGAPVTEAAHCYDLLRRRLYRVLRSQQGYARAQASGEEANTSLSRWSSFSYANMLLHQRDAALALLRTELGIVENDSFQAPHEMRLADLERERLWIEQQIKLEPVWRLRYAITPKDRAFWREHALLNRWVNERDDLLFPKWRPRDARVA